MSHPGPLTIFFSAGEPSGDLHGANLIRELYTRQPDLQAVGYGGPKMAAAGCRLHADLTTLAVMWFARAAMHLHRFWTLVSRADRFFQQHRPAAVVLIDFPGFNWWVARRAKAHRIPVFYYVPPQIWAWARWRVRKMRRLTDHVLCTLPFEEAWLRKHGCHTTLVGHPYFDELHRHQYDEAFIESQRSRPEPLVAILPGSRDQEVKHNLRWFLKAARMIYQEIRSVRFAVAAFKADQAELVRQAVAGDDLPLEIYVGKTPELIRAACCALAVSGSVSLELLYHAVPSVILYWISRPAFLVQSFFRKVKYITLVNLLACKGLTEGDLQLFDPAQPGAEQVPFPEYLTYEDRSAAIAGHIIQWLKDEQLRAARVKLLAGLRDRFAHEGASGRAAEYILQCLTGKAIKG